MASRVLTHLRRNVVAYIALFFALSGGTAYALAGSNTVFSDDITNDQVKTADVANDSAAGALRGGDIAANTLTGSDINESSLGAVPNATSLGGTPASGYARGESNASIFSPGSPLTLTFDGVGTFTMNCSDGGTPTDDSDDEIGDFRFTNQTGSDIVIGWSRQVVGSVAPGVAQVPHDVQYSFASSEQTPMYADLVVEAGGDAFTFSAVGEDVNGGTDCRGIIQAVRSR